MGYIKRFCYAVCAVVVALSAWAAYSDRVVDEIAAEVMRFHVLANSDDDADQAVKLAVRDGVLSALSDLDETLDKAATKAALESRLDEIERVAETVLREYGVDYGAKASIVRDYFPTREYGGVTLPAGVYETLRVELGDAGGRNWWCVMFPPLCFVDIVAGYTEKEEPKQELEHLLSAESLDLTTKTDSVKVRFFIVELWQQAKNLFGIN